MKYLLVSLSFFSAFLSFSCDNFDEIQSITVTNPSAFELFNKVIRIQRESIKVPEESHLNPLVLVGTDTIPSQLIDTDNNDSWDELFLVANFASKEIKVLNINWTQTNIPYEKKTSIRFGKRETPNEEVKPALSESLLAHQVYKGQGFQKYQTDGPSWENDKVGFRHYLDGRNAKDVFAKKIKDITPENVGISDQGAVEDNYHQMHDWGRDVFPVGNSTGLGGIALLVNNQMERLGITVNDTINNIEKTTFSIEEEGPVFSQFSIQYQNWKTSHGTLYQVAEKVSIWPGIYGYENTVSVSGLNEEDFLLIGLSNINNKLPLYEIKVGDYVCLIQHDSLTYEREWIMGTAIIVPKKLYQGYLEAPHQGQLTDTYLAKMKVADHQKVSYYAIAGWELSQEPRFKDPEFFKNYVINFAEQLSVPINISN